VGLQACELDFEAGAPSVDAIRAGLERLLGKAVAHRETPAGFWLLPDGFGLFVLQPGDGALALKLGLLGRVGARLGRRRNVSGALSALGGRPAGVSKWGLCFLYAGAAPSGEAVAAQLRTATGAAWRTSAFPVSHRFSRTGLGAVDLVFRGARVSVEASMSSKLQVPALAALQALGGTVAKAAR
jgi:hypothetical protein